MDLDQSHSCVVFKLPFRMSLSPHDAIPSATPQGGHQWSDACVIRRSIRAGSAMETGRGFIAETEGIEHGVDSDPK